MNTLTVGLNIYYPSDAMGRMPNRRLLIGLAGANDARCHPNSLNPLAIGE